MPRHCSSLERHSSRHGVPAVLYVDNETQLVSLEGINFTPQVLENELRDKLDVKVVVSCRRPMRNGEECRDGSG